MKKIFSLLNIIALITMMFGVPQANAAAPVAATLTSTGAITVNRGEIKAINALTITDVAGGEILAANDVCIKIPNTVNAVWDTTDTTAVIGGAQAAKVNATVSYPGATKKILKVAIDGDFILGDLATISGLSYIGYFNAGGPVALQWADDNTDCVATATYGAADATTNITVAVDGTHNVLTGATLASSSLIVGATSTYTVGFTIPAGGTIPADGVISLSFSGADLSAVAAVTSATVDGTLTPVANGSILTVTRSGAATNSLAGAYTLVIPGVINGPATDASTVIVTTSTSAGAATGGLAQVTTPAVTIVPVAITNLSCVASGSAGSVWLRWTNPGGVTNGYIAKYSLANITAPNFAAATTFTQTWTSGTVGQASQQLVTGLTPNALYYFNVEAKGVGASASAISNTVSCTAPTAYTSSSTTTAAHPTSTITAPVAQQGIQNGQPFTITGTSSDVGTYSIAKVEVSTDGGTTWNLAAPVTTSGTGFTWRYVWTAPGLGTYTIKSRATDYANAVETPGAGITVTVMENAPTITVEIGGVPTTTTTTTGTTTTTSGGTIQAQIEVLQQQLIVLLQQLLAQLVAQLGAH